MPVRIEGDFAERLNANTFIYLDTVMTIGLMYSVIVYTVSKQCYNTDCHNNYCCIRCSYTACLYGRLHVT